MNPRSFRHPDRELGLAWFLVPLGVACVSLLVLLLIARPSSSADELPSAPAAYISSDPSVPAASSVFSNGALYVPGLAVETF